MAVSLTVPKGFLPVYSVDSKAEAERLVRTVSSLGLDGKYYSQELATVRMLEGDEKGLDALEKLGDKIDRVHQIFIKRGTCKCKKKR